MRNPYAGLPDHQFWMRSEGIADLSLLDPVTDKTVQICRTDKVVTAGSCFAQHLASRLRASGFNHYITEVGHPVIPPKVKLQNGYGMFAARYGNIYTARQLLQLLHRAYGLFEPAQVSWSGKLSGRVVDPFRPQIQPGEFLNEEDLYYDRQQHFAAVRRAVEEMDIFIFTLGLTEAWQDPRDGAVFPIAPGVAGGRHPSNTAEFVNFDEEITYCDLTNALHFIRVRNPKVRFIITVSPVPLNATYVDRHVLVSTTWSKAVLRVAAEKVVRLFRDTAYFPSYEIITSPHACGKYYAEDRREVTEEGVSHVMGAFFRNLARGELEADVAVAAAPHDKHSKEMAERIEILCDEASIDNR